MIEGMLPAAVAACESREDIRDSPLYLEEEALLGRATSARRLEFATVRACARTALASLGLPPAPILPGPLGAPIWPAGVVGSMTHCPTYRAAAVAHAADVSSLGVDAEPNEPLPHEVLSLIADDGEQAWIAGLTMARPQVSWDRLLFTAKESVFKAWFPLTQRWLDFGQATVTVDPDGHTFSARLRVSDSALAHTPLTCFTGRWLASEGLIIAVVTVQHAASAP